MAELNFLKLTNEVAIRMIDLRRLGATRLILVVRANELFLFEKSLLELHDIVVMNFSWSDIYEGLSSRRWFDLEVKIKKLIDDSIVKGDTVHVAETS